MQKKEIFANKNTYYLKKLCGKKQRSNGLKYYICKPKHINN